MNPYSQPERFGFEGSRRVTRTPLSYGAPPTNDAFFGHGSPGTPYNERNAESYGNIVAEPRGKSPPSSRRQRSAPSSLRVFCGTWNVNGQRPQVALDSWLFPDGINSQPFDLYIVGLQEAQGLSKMNAVVADHLKGRAWLAQVQKTVGTMYSLVCFRQLVGICLIVLSRVGVPVQDLMIAEAGTGFLNVIGNKGGVAARFTIYNTSISCVSSHLAAHEQNIEKRNHNFQEILRRAVFILEEIEHNLTPASVSQILDHDVVFWVGDMNYRIDLPLDRVLECVQRNDWNFLSEHDQLTREMRAGRVAHGFLEGPLNFAPTYKYEAAIDKYRIDVESGVTRTPSWTDRILWRTSQNEVRLLHYRRHNVFSSDHRPVSAAFHVALNNATRSASSRHLATFENRFARPAANVVESDRYPKQDMGQAQTAKLQATPKSVDLPMMSYGSVVTSKVQFQYSGHFPVRLTLDVDAALLEWCSASFHRDTSTAVAQPDETVQLTIRGVVSRHHGLAEAVTMDAKPLTARITIRAYPTSYAESPSSEADWGGTPRSPLTAITIDVRGAYRKSFFGVSLQRLAQSQRPIRNIRETVPHDAPVLPMPKEVWLLGDAILSGKNGNEHKSGERSLAGAPGASVDSHIDHARELVDCGRSIAGVVDSSHAVVCLAAMLHELPTPLLDADTLSSFDKESEGLTERNRSRGHEEESSEAEEAEAATVAAEHALSSLSNEQRNTVAYIAALSRESVEADEDMDALSRVLAAAAAQSQSTNSSATRTAALLLQATPMSLRFPVQSYSSS